MMTRIVRGHKYVVFDLFHTAYDFATAHLPEQSNLAVKTVYFRRVNILTPPASAALRAKVNDEVADAHRANGWDVRPPFHEDRTKGTPTIYYNPRDMVTLKE
jgi:hypothetical protein